MLTFKKIAFFIFQMVMLSWMSMSYADDAANDSLSHLLKNMHSMQADFTQTILDKNGKTIQKATGHMELQRPNHFRWDVRTPNQQLLVANGKRLWVYDPDLEQVTIRKLVTAAGETPAMLLSEENVSLDKEFTIQQLNNEGAKQWFALTPKDSSSIISKLKMSFVNQQIHQMQLQDHLGHTTMIEFNHVKLNVELSPSLFTFNPPAHIDIIDETKH